MESIKQKFLKLGWYPSKDADLAAGGECPPGYGTKYASGWDSLVFSSIYGFFYAFSLCEGGGSR